MFIYRTAIPKALQREIEAVDAVVKEKHAKRKVQVNKFTVNVCLLECNPKSLVCTIML